jgi:uncharacterized membrane protein YdjX (TVP38/TMEM64 family)
MPTARAPGRSGTDAGRGRSRRGAALRVAGLVAVVIALVCVATTVRLPDLDDLRERIEGFGWWSWLVFVAAYAVVALTPIPVTIMALVGGLLFGVVAGSLLSVVGAVIGSVGAYWIARAVGRSTVMRLLGRHAERLEDRLDESSGFAAVFTLRVMPGMPYWPVNYGAGALGVPSRVFSIASLIASVPGQVSLVSIGAFLAAPSFWSGAIVVASWAVVLGFTIWAWRSWRGKAEHSLPGEPDPSDA